MCSAFNQAVPDIQATTYWVIIWVIALVESSLNVRVNRIPRSEDAFLERVIAPPALGFGGVLYVVAVRVSTTRRTLNPPSTIENASTRNEVFLTAIIPDVV